MAVKGRGTSRLRKLLATLAASLRLTWEASPAALTVTVVIASLAAVVPAILVWLGKHLVDLVVAGASDGSVSKGELLPTVLALGTLAAVLRALTSIQSNRQTLFASAVELHAERRLLEKVADADLGHFDDPVWHDRAARATRDLNWRPYSLAYTVVSLAGASVGVVGMLALLATVTPWLSLLAVVSVLPAVLVQRRVNKDIYDFWHVTTTEERQRQYLREVLSQPHAAKEVRAFGLAAHLLSRHARVTGDRLEAMGRLHLKSDLAVVFSALGTGVTLAASYWLVATRGVTGALSAGDLTVVVGAFAAVTGQMGVVLGSFFQLDQNAAFLDDYFSFLALERLLPVAAEPVPLPASVEDGIRFEGVTFTYPGGSIPALRDVDLHVRPGELLALVGGNGAGKTSLVKLLLRFYDPEQGSVRVGGVDVRGVDPAELRARIGVLFQDFVRYELSARDNVAFGRADRDPADEAVLAALQSAHAEDLVFRLPHGLDSNVGRLFEGGHDLSGGEWQRLALARLLFRDADIWVFDEPTSALDPEVEAAIFAKLRDLLDNRIGIVISHRFSTVRVADRIAVMAGGRITELGSHEELLEAGGTYARLFHLQAAGYR